MPQAMLPNDIGHHKRTQRYLFGGIAVSFLLHLICSALLLSTPQGSSKAAVTYLDLKNVRLPETISAPAPAPAAPAQKSPPAPEPEPAQQPEAVPQDPPVAPSPAPVAAEAPAPEKGAEPERSRSSIGLGLTKGYFKSLGEGATLRGDIKGYYLELLQGINETWWMDRSFENKKIAQVILTVLIARNGQIVGQSIVQSSGNRNYDRAVLASIEKAGPLPPLPPSYQGDFFEAPIRLVPPLNLLAW